MFASAGGGMDSFMTIECNGCVFTVSWMMPIPYARQRFKMLTGLNGLTRAISCFLLKVAPGFSFSSREEDHENSVSSKPLE